MTGLDVDPRAHESAFEAFADRALARFGDDIAHVVLFGSAARGDASGIGSDVDVFVVVADDSIEEALRDIAYDVQLEFGVVVSLHVQDRDRFEARSDHPFVRSVVQHGREYE